MKKIKVLGIILIICGLSLYLYGLISIKNKKIDETNKFHNTMDNIVGYKYVYDNKYTSILSIPKINLRKGIYDIDDSRNNIDENIMIDKNSIYPNNNISNIIFVAHSGVGDKAYFNRLKELDKDSLVEFYYNHTKYIYKIDHYYSVDKTGKVEIKYDKSKKTITLITCMDIYKQTIYVGYLIDEVNYQ